MDRIAARLDAVEAELAGVRVDARHSEHATRRAERLRELRTASKPLLAEIAARIEALRAS